MKALIATLGIYVITIATLFAQAPEKINYQGVARDNSGNILANQNVGLRLTIHSGTPTGTTVYTETQTPTTNQFGLFNIEFGGGSGFSSINWAGNSYYLQVEMDPTGGSNYQYMGTSQLLSVPYALNAKTSSDGWDLTGNAAVTSSNFIGSTNNAPLIIKVNNTQSGYISSDGNIGLGYHALETNLGAGDLNTALGNSALKANTLGNYNVAIGAGALDANTDGDDNIAIGIASLGSNTSGNKNTSVGAQSLPLNTGSDNSALGYGTLNDNTTGIANTAIGFQAANQNVDGDYNVAIGNNAMFQNNGDNNIAIGSGAFYSSTSGAGNTAVGNDALFDVTGIATNNVGLGKDAGNGFTTGTGNTFIGYNSTAGTGGINNSTAIGANATVSTSNSIVLGNAANVGIGTSSPASKLDVVGNIKVSGEVNNPSTGTANMIPVAYGVIGCNASIISGTGNFTCTLEGNGYKISFTSFSFDVSQHIVQVSRINAAASPNLLGDSSPGCSTEYGEIKYYQSGTSLIVTHGVISFGIPINSPFSFIIYKP